MNKFKQFLDEMDRAWFSGDLLTVFRIWHSLRVAIVRAAENEAKAPGLRWHARGEKPERANFYATWKRIDSHRSVRYWDDSSEAWLLPTSNGMIPNNSFDDWQELPTGPQ